MKNDAPKNNTDNISASTVKNFLGFFLTLFFLKKKLIIIFKNNIIPINIAKYLRGSTLASNTIPKNIIEHIVNKKPTIL
jgi:hypothetical protein